MWQHLVNGLQFQLIRSYQKLSPSIEKMDLKKKFPKYAWFGHQCCHEEPHVFTSFWKCDFWILICVGTLVKSLQVTHMPCTALTAAVSEQSWLHFHYIKISWHEILKEFTLILTTNKCMQWLFSEKTFRTSSDIYI